MATFQRFEDIEAWQRARELTNAVYDLSDHHPFKNDFGLKDQIRRASVSIMSNIAEGFERGGTAEFSKFLWIAKGSAGEVMAQLYVASDRGYLDETTFRRMYDLTQRTGQMIGGLISYLGRTGISGQKYRSDRHPGSPPSGSEQRETRNAKRETQHASHVERG